MTTISVALATFNGQRFLGDQLKSLAAQETLPQELVVADDGSSDDTMTVLREFAQSAPFPVRVFQNEARLGYRANFVRVAAECTGDLIAFCDQDDIWDSRKLRLMQGAFADPDVLLAYHNSRLVDEAGIDIGTVHPRRRQTRTFAPLATRPWQVIPGHTQVMRRSLTRFDRLHLESIDPFTPGAIAPYDDWYQFWASVLGKMTYVADVLVDYRQHGGSTSGWPYVTLKAYLIDHIVNAESYAIGSANGAINRLGLLDRSRALLTDAEQPRVASAIQVHDALSRRYARRSKIYREKQIAGRAGHLFTLLNEGAYFGSGHHGFGLDTLLLDTFVGVLCPPLGRVKASAT